MSDCPSIAEIIGTVERNLRRHGPHAAPSALNSPMYDQHGLIPMRQVVLRDYQQALVDEALRAAETHRRVCLYGPTGGGKTEVGLALVRHFVERNLHPMWVANRIDLIEQTSRRFAVAGVDHGIIQAKHEYTNYRKPVQICSIQTLARRRTLPRVDVIIVDEAHGAVSPTYRKFLDEQNVPVFGLTATPFSKGLGTVFDTVVFTKTVADLVADGWLVPARYFAPDRPDLRGVRITAGDYNELDLAQRVDTSQLVGNIVDEWEKRARGKKTVVFATSIAHSQHIVEQFRFRGYAAEHIDAYTEPEERRAIINRLRSGETTIISNVSVLAEGFDCPDMECMILARPTKSVIRYLQMVGRVLRPAEGKEHALVLDHSATVETLGFADDPREIELDDGKSAKRNDADRERPTYTCPQCKAVTPRRVVPCPSCGFVPEKVRAQFEGEVQDGTLREIERKYRTHEQKQAIYSAIIAYAESKNFKPGWVAHTYKDMTGVWPKGLEYEPGPPVPEVTGFIKHKLIAWAHSKKRQMSPRWGSRQAVAA